MPNQQNAGSTDPRLFLFCIGGTGTRVLKSLMFLLAAGVDIKASSVVPIIIDPDRSNGDVSRTVNLLDRYQKIREYLEKDGFKTNKFFKTKIQTLSSLDTEEQRGDQGYRFGIDGTNSGKFRDFLGMGQLNDATRQLVETLFTVEELNEDLDVGFKGRPHMGSIVLNKFSESEDFALFANRIEPNDRVFVASSIFGGTGAAGFPLLVKNIRQPSENISRISKPQVLKEAKVGAVTVLPYFSIKVDAGSAIDSGTFMSKAKAALEYYHKNLSGNNSLNALYYIGDTRSGQYENHEGSTNQKNKAHLVEMLSALAVIDFMAVENGSLETSPQGQAFDPIYKEYGLSGGDQAQVNFNHLGNETRRRLMQPLTQYIYCMQYWNNHLNLGEKVPWTKDFDNAFLQKDFYKRYLSMFNSLFRDWINEMAKNERAFNPFRLDVPGGQLHTVTNGIEQKRKWRGFGRSSTWDSTDYTGYLNEAIKSIPTDDQEIMFMSVFHKATELIYEDRIKI